MEKKKIAIYLRLSKEERNKIRNHESNSIQNQRDIIKAYIDSQWKKEDREILEFVDDGYSGVNFVDVT